MVILTVVMAAHGFCNINGGSSSINNGINSGYGGG